MQAAIDAVTAGVDLEDGNFHYWIGLRNAFTYLQDAVDQVSYVFYSWFLFCFVTHLLSSFLQGILDEDFLNASVKRLFTARMRLGEFDPVSMNPYNRLNVNTSVDTPGHRELARTTARQMQVLLKNEPVTSSGNSVLPLSKSSLKNSNAKVKLFGPQGNSSNSLFGDYAPSPSFVVTPVQGVQSIFSSGYDENDNPTNPDFATWKVDRKASRIVSDMSISFTKGCDSVFCKTYDNTSVIQAAQEADVAILFMGLSNDIEAEGNDRSTIE